MPPYPKRKKYLSISSKELEELRKEYAKDDSLLVWMQRQRKWLWLLYAALVLLFAMGVIFPKVDFRISDEVIRLDRKNYPDLRTREKHISSGYGGRTRISSDRHFLDIEYKRSGTYRMEYRCVCSGLCYWKNNQVYEIEWIDIQRIELINAKKRNFCVVKQVKFLNEIDKIKNKIDIFKPDFLSDNKTSRIRKYSKSYRYIETIKLNILNLSLQEEWNRFYYMCFLILFSVGLIRNWFRYGNNDV